MTAPLSQNGGPDQPPDAAPQSLAKSHPVLLMVVIGLGVAIIVVVALMVGLVLTGARSKPAAGKPPTAANGPAPEAAGPAAPANYNTMIVREGTAIADARIDGGLLILRTTNDEAEEVMTFDPKTGQLLARITLKKLDRP